MKIKTSIFIFLIFKTIVALAQEKEVQISYYGGIKAIYECKNEMFHGKYQSYYKNGQKCATGNFEYNSRVGEWSVWDSNGNLRVKRVYKSPFVYNTTFPKAPSTPLVKLLNVPPYQPTRNKEGFMKDHFIHEKMVFFEQMNWIYVPNNSLNSLWIENTFHLIHPKVLKNEVQPYSDYAFDEKMPLDSLTKDSLDIIGFKIKEVFFFDTDRFLSEKRMISVAPVVINNRTKDTIDLYWLYYPDIRPILAQKSFKPKSTVKNIQNLDDILFFRYFSSYILESSVPLIKEKIPSDLSKNALEANSDKIKISNLEVEHMYWITFSRNK
jgi:hypothetical protein